MNFARPTDGLLPSSSTVKLVELLGRRPKGASVDSLIRDLSAIVQVSRSQTLNTIIKLESYGLFAKIPRGYLLSSKPEAAGWRELISGHATSEFADRLSKTCTWRCVSINPTTRRLTIDSKQLPPLHDGTCVWLIDFGIAHRATAEDRYWVVSEAMAPQLLDEARSANKKSPRRAKSAERLALELSRQAELGEEAEIWVLDYERRRLSNHPLRSQVRKISSDDVSAGYDIASFETARSINHDRFIEVKSHGERKIFHWSRNEISTAIEFGNDYALYLVDRTRMACPDYQPHIITGPTPEMFSRARSGWSVEATSFEHIAVP